jgi:hypothetical protein
VGVSVEEGTMGRECCGKMRLEPKKLLLVRSVDGYSRGKDDRVILGADAKPAPSHASSLSRYVIPRFSVL